MHNARSARWREEARREVQDSPREWSRRGRWVVYVVSRKSFMIRRGEMRKSWSRLDLTRKFLIVRIGFTRKKQDEITVIVDAENREWTIIGSTDPDDPRLSVKFLEFTFAIALANTRLCVIFCDNNITSTVSR